MCVCAYIYIHSYSHSYVCVYIYFYLSLSLSVLPTASERLGGLNPARSWWPQAMLEIVLGPLKTILCEYTWAERSALF